MYFNGLCHSSRKSVIFSCDDHGISRVWPRVNWFGSSIAVVRVLVSNYELSSFLEIHN